MVRPGRRCSITDHQQSHGFAGEYILLGRRQNHQQDNGAFPLFRSNASCVVPRSLILTRIEGFPNHQSCTASPVFGAERGCVVRFKQEVIQNHRKSIVPSTNIVDARIGASIELKRHDA
jgi:hypothetical protein